MRAGAPGGYRLVPFLAMLARRRVPLSARIFARIMLGSAVTFVILLMIAGVTVGAMTRWADQVDLIDSRIPPARAAASDIQFRLTASDQAVIAYVTSSLDVAGGTPSYLQPYQQARAAIRQDLSVLTRLAKSYPSLDAVPALAAEIQVREDGLDGVIALAQSGQTGAAEASPDYPNGSASLLTELPVQDALDAISSQIGDVQQGAIESFQETVDQTRIVVVAIVVVGALGAAASAIWIAFVVANSLAQHQEEIEAANARLTEVSRVKSQFVATMSHELRTPLNAIIGFSEMLQRESVGPLTVKQRRYIDNVLNSGRHLLGLINDVLDLSKVEAGKMDLRMEPVPLDSLVQEPVSVIRGMADRKGVTVEIGAIPPSIVMGDVARLRQVLFNLLSNAIKFTPAGGAVQLSARRLGTYIAIAVRDTGIGIAPKDQERIFEEFQQLDSSASREFQGTGLGLALSRRLVALHGGTLTVESDPGKGSTFTFTVPALAEQEAAA